MSARGNVCLAYKLETLIYYLSGNNYIAYNMPNLAFKVYIFYYSHTPLGYWLLPATKTYIYIYVYSIMVIHYLEYRPLQSAN